MWSDSELYARTDFSVSVAESSTVNGDLVFGSVT